MSKKFVLGICVLAIAILAFGTLGTGAWWSIQTTNPGTVQAATFDVSAGSASGTCSATNLAPGDDAVSCKIMIYNNSSIPINVLWSGFTLADTKGMADWLFITDFSDINDQTSLAQLLPGFAGPDGKMTLREMVTPLSNGYFSNPDGTNSYLSTFVPAGGTGWVNLSYAFGALAPNSTIGGSASFTWTLTAQQLPKNPTP